MSFPTVVFFHQIVGRKTSEHTFFRNSPTFDQFRRFAIEAKKRYRIIGIEEFCAGWENGRRWPPRSVMITFDDGFKNNLRAARILNELGIEATFFVLSDVIDSPFMPWYLRFAHIVSTRSAQRGDLEGSSVDLTNLVERRRWMRASKERLLAVSQDQRAELLDQLSDQLGSRPIDPKDPDYAYFSSEDLRELRRMGMAVGSHSATHTNLVTCDAVQLRREIVGSRKKLGEALGEPVDFLSYPDGRFNNDVLDLTAKHYRFAFAASWRYPPDNRWRYPRRNTNGNLTDLSRWYPTTRRIKEAVKKCLRV